MAFLLDPRPSGAAYSCQSLAVTLDMLSILPVWAAALPLPLGQREEVNMGRQQARVEPKTDPSAPAVLVGGGIRRPNMYWEDGREPQPSHTKAGIMDTAAATPMVFALFAVPF